jgi:hypothetical protein
MAQAVGGGVFGDASGTDGGFDGALDDGLMEVVPPPISGGAVHIVTGRWENPLPRPVAARGRVLSVEGVGERDRARAGGEILGVLSTYLDEVRTQRGLDAGGKHGHAIFASFPVVNGELVAVEVQVLGAKLRALEDAQACSVQQGSHEMGRASHTSSTADTSSRDRTTGSRAGRLA